MKAPVDVGLRECFHDIHDGGQCPSSILSLVTTIKDIRLLL